MEVPQQGRDGEECPFIIETKHFASGMVDDGEFWFMINITYLISHHVVFLFLCCCTCSLL